MASFIKSTRAVINTNNSTVTVYFHLSVDTQCCHGAPHHWVTESLCVDLTEVIPHCSIVNSGDKLY